MDSMKGSTYALFTKEKGYFETKKGLFYEENCKLYFLQLIWSFLEV